MFPPPTTIPIWTPSRWTSPTWRAMKATKVDGVYDADPQTHPHARRYAELEYADLLRDQLKVLDAAAVSLCMENDLPIVVFDLNQPDNITRVAAGEPVGTLISGNAGANGGSR